MPRIPLEFLTTYASFNWHDVHFGLSRQWLAPRDAIDFAVKRLSEADEYLPEECELAAADSNAPIAALVEVLSRRWSNDGEERRWMNFSIAWMHHRGATLGDVEELWCEFGHPRELERFVRFMPAEDSTRALALAGTDHLEQDWSEYAAAVAQSIGCVKPTTL